MWHNRRMRYETIKNLKDKDFKRLTGVKPETFRMMRDILAKKQANFGRPPSLVIEDQLLVALMYWREYRTQFHIAQSYGVSEATVSRIIRKVETVLMQSGQFRLPGRKALYDTETVIEVIIVDVTEQPVERPKKTETILQRQEKATHTESASGNQPKNGTGHSHVFRQGTHPRFSLVERKRHERTQRYALFSRFRVSGIGQVTHQQRNAVQEIKKQSIDEGQETGQSPTVTPSYSSGKRNRQAEGISHSE